MASWEEELAVLLRELGVIQEEPTTDLRPTLSGEAGPPRETPRQRQRNQPRRRDGKHRAASHEHGIEHSADALFWNENVSEPDDEEDDDIWLTDLTAMRREVDTIVSQVIHLLQPGDHATSLKEDVMVVLRALHRRAMVHQQASTSDEAYLEFATAMLHFCRLVLRLSEPAIEDI